MIININFYFSINVFLSTYCIEYHINLSGYACVNIMTGDEDGFGIDTD